MVKVAICSGKGGTGKTTVAINLALGLAEAGRKVVLFDADLQLANIDVSMGIRPEFNLHDVVTGEKSLRQILVRDYPNLGIVSGGSAIVPLMTAGPKRLGVLFEQIEELAADTHVVLFDTAAGLENRVTAFTKFADQAVVVTTPDPTSVTDAYATVKTIWRKSPTVPISIVANMVGNEREANAVVEAIQKIANSFLGRSPAFLGWVRSDPRIALALRRRKPFLQMAPTSGAANDFRNLAASLDGALGTRTRLSA